jgi:hypothetical protein
VLIDHCLPLQPGFGGADCGEIGFQGSNMHVGPPIWNATVDYSLLRV